MVKRASGSSGKASGRQASGGAEKVLYVRLTEREHGFVLEEARKAGVTAAEWGRRLIAGERARQQTRAEVTRSAETAIEAHRTTEFQPNPALKPVDRDHDALLDPDVEGI